MRQSLKRWEKSIKIQSFETVDTAKERTKEVKKKIETGQQTMKNHVGNHKSYSWDKSGLEEEVNWFKFNSAD